MKSTTGAKTPTPAADVCKHFELSEPARALLQPTSLPRPYLELLIAKQLHQDAARFMAHAMPRREAIWWSSLCARQAYGAKAPEKQAPALEAAELWITKPDDEQRRTTYKLAESAGFNNPAGLIGMAVFFSSGSIAPPGVAEVLPEPHLCQGAVGNAVIISAVYGDSSKAQERFLQFFAMGFDVANGKNRWKEA